jgi:hypothetical protein
MSKFKEGDEVQISNKSIYAYQGLNRDGEKMRGVINHLSSDGWWEVTWDNNFINTYPDDDLEPYKKPTPKEQPEKNVTFEVNGQKFKYSLASTHYDNGGNNDIIFSELKVDKHSFCSEAYGYKAYGGSWPEWRDGDNEAPIKIVKAIREKIKQMESQPESEPQKYRFQVGDTVIGNEEANKYGVTVKGWRGTVVKLGKFDFSAEDRSGTTFNDLNYECFDLVKSEPEPIDIEALLEEANRRYPIGTLYKELDNTGKVTGALREASEEANWVVRGESIEVGYGYVYANGKWAEVESKSELTGREALLKEARRLYPIGTKYRPLNSDGTEHMQDAKAEYECNWVQTGLGIDCGDGYVYANGKWAKIVNEDKYVVTQRIPSPSGGVYALTPGEIDISAAVIRNVWMDLSTKQLPDAQTPIIVSRSKNKSKIKVL